MEKRDVRSQPYKAIACIENPSLDLDRNPIVDKGDVLKNIRLVLAEHNKLEESWDHLVKSHHYLGYRSLLGHRLKYLALLGNRPIAALSWSAPALRLAVRDRFIGWTNEQRKQYLNRIASNSRFLILPWVRIENLASHLLARNSAQLSEDWAKHFGQDLWLVETFVDPRKFKGTCYKAANWRLLGLTQGSTKQGKGYIYHGQKKEVYVYVLKQKFRDEIGCKEIVILPPTFKKAEEFKMLLRDKDWDPNVIPPMDINEDMLGTIADELVNFHQEFYDCFKCDQNREMGLTYLSGLLSNCREKSIEPIALEFLGEDSVRNLQRFMKTYKWDQQKMEAKNMSMLAPLIASPTGMINTDASDFAKKGKESVGVARQYCGSLGKVENCQSGVFVGYASEKGYALLTSQLYMPESWFSEAQKKRRKDNLVPNDLIFKTKNQIALELIQNVVRTGLFPAKWVGCDAAFGSDWEFINSIPKELWYFASIRSNTKIFLEKPMTGIPAYTGRGRKPKKEKPARDQPTTLLVSDIANSPNTKWENAVLAEGAKGPVVAEVCRVRVYPARDGLAKEESVWLFIRKIADGQIKYAFSNAPETISLKELCEASTLRWPIEQCFQEGKSYLGMDQYEHRSWPAWHRHMLYVFLAQHFLLRLRILFKKNSNANAAVSSKAYRNDSAT